MEYYTRAKMSTLKIVGYFKKPITDILEEGGTLALFAISMLCYLIYAYTFYLVQFPLYCFTHIVRLAEMQITVLKYTRFL